MSRWFNRDAAISIAFFAALGLAWEYGVRWSGVQSYLLPPPSAILGELWQSRGPILSQSLVTLTEVFWGFLIAVALGVPIAALIHFSRTAKSTVYPLFVALQSIPKIGLAPLIVADIFRTIGELRQAGVSVLLVEQNARAALEIADRAYVMELGEFVMSGSAKEISGDQRVVASYLGFQHGESKV